MVPDPYRYFRVEAAELLERLNRAALELERGKGSEQVVPTMLRHAHTLKGAARVVRRVDIAELAHGLEDLLEPHRESTSPAPGPALLQKLGQELDAIARALRELDGLPEAPGAARVANEPLTESRAKTVRAEIEQIDLLVTAMNEAIAGQTNHGRDAVAAIGAARDAAERLSRQLTLGASEQSPRTSEFASQAATRLVALLGDVESKIRASADGVSTELELALIRAQGLRLVPADTIFTLLERAASEAARSLGKRVLVTTIGGSEAVDARTLEIVQSALLHLVRNAVAHGVETSEQRRAKGKSEQGHVRISVERDRDNVTFKCHDDGKGVDLDALRAKLRQRNAVVPVEASSLLHTLLEAGVSTASTVDELSGRGVGLDAVRAAVDELGGKVTLHNEVGLGFTVELVVPARLRMLDGLDVESGEARATVPIFQLVEGLLLDRPARERVSSAGGLPYQGVVLPVVSLEGALGLPARDSPHTAVLVMNGRGGRVALTAERIGAVRRTVLHEAPALALATPSVLGVILDRTGEPRVVLDADGVRTQAQGRARAVAKPSRRSPRVLVVDDSLTTRMLEQSILEANGYEVELAVSAEDGMKKAVEGDYALYLVDVEMPGADGFWFVAETRANPRLRGTPAVLVSSRSSEHDLARGAAVGAAGYIVKHEFDQREFLLLVSRLAGRG